MISIRGYESESDASFSSSSQESAASGSQEPAASSTNATAPSTKAVYKLVEEFESAGEAAYAVSNLHIWSKSKYNENKFVGEKQFYRCNLAKKSAKPCKAKLFILYHDDSQKASVYMTTDGHDHQDRVEKPIKANYEFINRLIDLKLKPKSIIASLEEANIRPPKTLELYNHIAYYKRLKFGKNLSIGELCEYLENHHSVPESEDEPFVVKFEQV
jgi:hypothetical protein